MHSDYEKKIVGWEDKKTDVAIKTKSCNKDYCTRKTTLGAIVYPACGVVMTSGLLAYCGIVQGHAECNQLIFHENPRSPHTSLYVIKK